jgi:hypothetical protein
MEDNKIAKKLLSLIMEEEIETLEFIPKDKRNELEKRSLTVLYIDFLAKIRLPDGSQKVVLIELQKAKFASDIPRFRRYLGTQYASANNTYEDEKGRRKSMPILSIYLLGHYLDKVRIPTIRVNRTYQDAATKKEIHEKEEFIECLTHDSIVIQIPALRESRRNKLEKVLSVFNNAKEHLIDIQESDYPEEYHEVIRRLLKAASEPEVRETMTVEDEYLEELESLERKAYTAREEGRQEGEKNKALEIARNLLKKGLTPKEAAEMTGLTEEEIQKLREE